MADQTTKLAYLFDINEEDITATMIMDLFGEFNGKAKCSPSDTIRIPKGKYGPEGKKNKNEFTTTVGIWIFNKLMIEKDFFDIFGYINETIDKGKFKKINQELSYALIEDRITIDQMSRYVMKPEWFMQFVSVLGYNYNEKILTCSEVANKKKKELIKKYEKEIEAGDLVAMNKVETETLNHVLDYMGDDNSLDVFKSGARGNFGNNFKNMFVMRGAVKNNDVNSDKDFVFASSNYLDGIKAEEYSLFADAMTEGPYNRGIKTQLGGHWEKLFKSAYETIVLDKEGTDCGTKKCITVTLTNKNISGFMYSWIQSGSSLVELTSQNKDKYLGKTVKIRFPIYCKHKSKTGSYCSKCAGNLMYRTGRKNVGVISPMIPSILKNVSMSSFHDASVKLNKMDVNKAFGFED